MRVMRQQRGCKGVAQGTGVCVVDGVCWNQIRHRIAEEKGEGEEERMERDRGMQEECFEEGDPHAGREIAVCCNQLLPSLIQTSFAPKTAFRTSLSPTPSLNGTEHREERGAASEEIDSRDRRQERDV